MAGGHLEQAGRWTGSCTVDGERFALDGARGNRDKSWGARQTDGSRGLTMWRWFSVNVGDATHLGGVRIGTPAGDLHRGWVSHEGEVTSIVQWDIATTVDPEGDGIRHSALDVVATDKAGRAHTLHGDVLRAEKLGGHGPGGGASGALVYEGLTRWTTRVGREASDRASAVGRREPGPERPGASGAESGRVGYGVSEYTHVLGADGKPVVPIE